MLKNRVYQDAKGVCWVNGHGNAPGDYGIRYSDDNKVRIYLKATNQTVFFGDPCDLMDKDGVNYDCFEDFLEKVCPFFGKAPLVGGVGEIKLLASLAAPPIGWLACNGASVSRITYPALLEALIFKSTALVSLNSVVATIASTTGLFVGMKVDITGDLYTITAVNDSTTFSFTPAFGLSGFGPRDVTFYPYGTADVNTFNLPNLCGKVPVGYDSAQTEFKAVGKTGGAKTHTLTENEMPMHTHTVNRNNVVTVGREGGVVSEDWCADDDQFTPVQSGSKGGGLAHNNLQPFLTLNYIIKT